MNRVPKKKSGIEWSQWSWNPITGCNFKCPYCYARRIAHRMCANTKKAWEKGRLLVAFPQRFKKR